MSTTPSSNPQRRTPGKPTAAELERKLLLTAAELAIVLGVGDEVCRQIRNRADFPAPIHNTFYSRPQVMRWLDGGTAQEKQDAVTQPRRALEDGHYHGEPVPTAEEFVEDTMKWLEEETTRDRSSERARPAPARMSRVG